MKKVTTFLMSALTLVIALTAWANAEKLGAPRGVTTPPAVTSVEPNAPVEKLEKVVFVFDQPIVYSGIDMVGVYPADSFDAVASAAVAVDLNDDTRLVATLVAPITTSGKYILDIDGTCVESKNGNGSTNDMLSSYSFEVAGGSTPVVPGDKLNFQILYPDGSEFEDNFPNFAVKFDNYNVTFDNTKNVTLSNGSVSHNLTLNTMFFDVQAEPQVMFMAGDLELAAGQWTLNIPAGIFKGADGAENEAASYTYTLKKSGSVDVPDVALQVTSLNYYQYIDKDPISGNNRYEAPVAVNNGTVIPSLFVNDKIEIATNVNEYLGVLWLDVYKGEIVKDDAGYDVNPPVRSFYTYNKNANGNFEIEVSGADLKLEDGVEYTLCIFAADTENVAPSDRNYFKSDVNPITYKIKGSAEAYKYSDVTLISVEPELTKEIVDENQEFSLEFSAPVTIDASIDESGNPSSGTVLGFGTAGAFEKLEKGNAEGTVWKYKPDPSFLLNCTATADFMFKVIDAQGLIVKPADEEGVEDATRIRISYDCHLACPTVRITPAASTLEKIYSFSADTEDGSDINLGSALDKPYLTTAGGYRVAEVDMNSVKRFDAAGNDIDAGGDGGSDVGAKKVTFNLDKEITAPGKYILHCPFGAFALGSEFTGSSSRTMQIAYTIEGTPIISGTTIPAGAEISELSLAGFYADSSVELVIPEAEAGETVRVPKLQLRNDDGTVGNYDIIIANNGGRSIIMADFNENGKPLSLDPGVNYTMRIAAGALAIEGTDMLYPEMSLSVKGAEATAVEPEFVKLTYAVADHVSSVSEVAKGKSVKLALTPAAGWKVQKVTLDNKDVTADVKNNEYTTPELSADARVDVALAFDGVVFTPASADQVFSDFNLRAWSEGGKIYIAGLEVGMKLNVFTVAGALAGSYVADDTVVACEVASGVYVVVVTDKAGKSQAFKIQNK